MINSNVVYIILWSKIMIIDLETPEHAYFYGFALTDGHLSETTRNRGKFQLEISIRDKNILYQMKDFFNVNTTYRERKKITKFSKNKKYETCILSIYDFNFRHELKSYGFPVGKKSYIASPPNTNFNEIDFVRGLLDGDGSVGFTKQNLPFISFTTKSESLKNYYVDFLYRYLNIKLNPHLNTRDKIYNIMINCYSAQRLYKLLYYPSCICLDRKKNDNILNWKSKSGRIRLYKRNKWTAEEDNFILTHDIQTSIKELNRTEKSINIRLWRLKNHMIK